ncbi:hypothetical protein SNEBB_006509 [Seison nebaliae]|nr:hypothetical protein SNEBB_006509 [Seison nebaliae]
MPKNKVHAAGVVATKANKRSRKAYKEFLKRMATAKKSLTDIKQSIGKKLRKKRKVAPIPLPVREPLKGSTSCSDLKSKVQYNDLVNAVEWRRPTKSCTILGAERSLSIVEVAHELPPKYTSKTGRWYRATLPDSDMKSEVNKEELWELKEWYLESGLFNNHGNKKSQELDDNQFIRIDRNRKELLAMPFWLRST